MVPQIRGSLRPEAAAEGEAPLRLPSARRRLSVLENASEDRGVGSLRQGKARRGAVKRRAPRASACRVTGARAGSSPAELLHPAEAKRKSVWTERPSPFLCFFFFIIIIFNCFSFFFFFSQWETCKVELTTLFFPSCLPLAVVSVDGKPVRLQLCDTAGQVSEATKPSDSRRGWRFPGGEVTQSGPRGDPGAWRATWCSLRTLITGFIFF